MAHSRHACTGILGPTIRKILFVLGGGTFAASLRRSELASSHGSAGARWGFAF